MPDNWSLQRDADVVNLGSYIDHDKQIDFDFGKLFQAAYADSQFVDGGVLAYEHSGVRTFKFPLIVPSAHPFIGGLPGLVALVRRAAKPGGWIDLQPNGIASAEAVRFDVLQGRVQEAYDPDINRISRRRADLLLDVQPFGYWPTWINMASAASVGLPGMLAISPSSFIGDLPMLAQIVVQPTMPTVYPGGSWYTDFLAISVGARSSFQAWWPAGSVTGDLTSSLGGQPFVAGSQSLNFSSLAAAGGWSQAAHLIVATALEPAYRGRFRMYALARVWAANSGAWQLAGDVVGGLQTGRALASAQPVATVVSDVASTIPASPGFQFIDLGLVTAPPVGSGISQQLSFRLWLNGGSAAAAAASFALGGVYLLPAVGAGVMPRGLAQPSILTPSVGRFALDSYGRTVMVQGVAADLSVVQAPLGDGQAFYRGDMIRLTPSTVEIDVLAGSRKAASGATAPIVRSAPGFAAVSVSARPQFAFLKGI